MKRARKRFARTPPTKSAAACRANCPAHFDTASTEIISMFHVRLGELPCPRTFSHRLPGSAYDSALNGAASFSSLFPLAASFLPQSAASQFLSETSAQHQSAHSTSSSTTPSLLSAAGNSSPVIVPVTIGESALQSAVKAAAAAHGNNNNNGSESVSGD